MSTKDEVYHQEASGPCPYPQEEPYRGQTTTTIPAPVAATPVYPASTVQVKEKSVVEAYLLWLVFGVFGFHHFYLNRTRFGILYFFTFGLCCVGVLIDLFRIPHLVREENQRLQSPEPRTRQKTISDAYTLWFPFGLLGFHHFYLGHFGFGTLYFFTFGLCGIGWLIDLFRIPGMVRRVNSLPLEQRLEKSLATAYILGLSPFGFLGFHHFYLKRPYFGVFYIVTFANLGFGYLLDLFRMPVLVRRANKNIFEGPNYEKHLDDAYLVWFPYGVAGCHHFYLGRPVWGIIYFLTFGLFGIGWLVDAVRMPYLVKEYNKCIHQMTDRTPILSNPRHDGYATAAPPPSSGIQNIQTNNPSVGQYQHPGYPQLPISHMPQHPEPGDQRLVPTAPSYMDDPPPPYTPKPEPSDNTSGYQTK